MSFSAVVVIILAIVFGCLFFLVDYYEQKLIILHASFIAGISVAYFFLIVLPEITENMPEFPFDLQIFEYLFVLIGFTLIHINKKIIVQKVESRAQRKIRKLIVKEKTLEAVEKNMENVLTREITNEEIDELALRDIARTLSELNDKEQEMKAEIIRYKLKIHNHINKNLQKFRSITDYTYHFLVGIILVGLLIVDIIPGVLFFFYAFFRSIVSRRSERHIIFTDLEIYEEFEYNEKFVIKLILSTSALVGIGIGFILNAFLPKNLELLFIFYSFISGVILYVIVSEVIPEKEKGKPLKFIIGLVGFTIIILLINIFT
ncbi:MAG: hypothetical protein ACW990_17330, partial [Promethearchaeota archaeon]